MLFLGCGTVYLGNWATQKQNNTHRKTEVQSVFSRNNRMRLPKGPMVEGQETRAPAPADTKDESISPLQTTSQQDHPHRNKLESHQQHGMGSQTLSFPSGFGISLSISPSEPQPPHTTSWVFLLRLWWIFRSVWSELAYLQHWIFQPKTRVWSVHLLVLIPLKCAVLSRGSTHLLLDLFPALFIHSATTYRPS